MVKLISNNAFAKIVWIVFFSGIPCSIINSVALESLIQITYTINPADKMIFLHNSFHEIPVTKPFRNGLELIFNIEPVKKEYKEIDDYKNISYDKYGCVNNPEKVHVSLNKVINDVQISVKIDSDYDFNQPVKIKLESKSNMSDYIFSFTILKTTPTPPSAVTPKPKPSPAAAEVPAPTTSPAAALAPTPIPSPAAVLVPTLTPQSAAALVPTPAPSAAQPMPLPTPSPASGAWKLILSLKGSLPLHRVYSIREIVFLQYKFHFNCESLLFADWYINYGFYGAGSFSLHDTLGTYSVQLFSLGGNILLKIPLFSSNNAQPRQMLAFCGGIEISPFNWYNEKTDVNENAASGFYDFHFMLNLNPGLTYEINKIALYLFYEYTKDINGKNIFSLEENRFSSNGLSISIGAKL